MYLFDKKLDVIEKIHRTTAYLIRISFLIAIVGALLNKQWVILFVSSLAFILTFLPYIIEKSYRIRLPVEFELLSLLFIFATLFLGEVHAYYTRYWWWDIVLHTGSGIAFGFLGFIMLYVLYEGKKINARPSTIAIFAFCFALAIGALWEIFEFIMDHFFVLNMQKSGLVDTMSDLIVDSLGALLTSISGYFYIRGTRVRLFDRFVNRFVRENSNLFRFRRK